MGGGCQCQRCEADRRLKDERASAEAPAITNNEPSFPRSTAVNMFGIPSQLPAPSHHDLNWLNESQLVELLDELKVAESLTGNRNLYELQIKAVEQEINRRDVMYNLSCYWSINSKTVNQMEHAVEHVQNLIARYRSLVFGPAKDDYFGVSLLRDEFDALHSMSRIGFRLMLAETEDV